MSRTKTAAFNAQIVAGLERAAAGDIGEQKQAQLAMGEYTRTGIFEASFLGRILPKETVTNDDFIFTMDESLAVGYEKQPQSAPSKWVPFGTMPESRYITSSKYIIPAAKLQSDEMQKDIDELRTVKMPIQKYLTDDLIRWGIESIDGRWIELCNSILDDSNRFGIQRQTGKQQLIAFTDTLNRQTWVDAINLMYRGSTFKGMERMYRLDTKLALMSRATMNEFIKMDRNAFGGDMAQDNLVNGLQSGQMGGIDLVATLKNDIIPDNWVYFFTAPEYLGHYFEVRGWTTFTEMRGTILKFFSHWLGGAGIGNIAGVTLAKFNQPAN